MLLEIHTIKQQSTKVHHEITRGQLIEMLSYWFNVPKNATLFVHVPGGGDYSNTDLLIENGTYLQVDYESNVTCSEPIEVKEI